MKKIMFNDKYGLTQAVLEGRKTMTRRIIKGDYENIVVLPHGSYIVGYNGSIIESSAVELHPSYQIGEIAAVAMSYRSIIELAKEESKIKNFLIQKDLMTDNGYISDKLLSSPGYRNKMFVAAGLMPHRIRTTDIKVERLQDISEEDCLREGIVQDGEGVASYSFKEWIKRGFGDTVLPRRTYAATPRVAFASLIDRISGKGTWERNPWVFAYEFELVK